MPPSSLGRFAALAAGVRLGVRAGAGALAIGVGAKANAAADDVLGLIAGVPSST